VCVAVLQNGYWKKWQTLKGGNAEGTLDWEETWWEASDWTGLKEMGARKEGECVVVGGVRCGQQALGVSVDAARMLYGRIRVQCF
jgi:hypothetical protein